MSPGKIAGVTPDKDTLDSCGIVPALDDGSLISGHYDACSSDRDAPIPVEDPPAVVDRFSSFSVLVVVCHDLDWRTKALRLSDSAFVGRDVR